MARSAVSVDRAYAAAQRRVARAEGESTMPTMISSAVTTCSCSLPSRLSVSSPFEVARPAGPCTSQADVHPWSCAKGAFADDRTACDRSDLTLAHSPSQFCRRVCSAGIRHTNGRRAPRGRAVPGVRTASLPRQSQIAAATPSREAGSAWLATGAQMRPPALGFVERPH
jgi:hypothetical protein